MILLKSIGDDCKDKYWCFSIIRTYIKTHLKFFAVSLIYTHFMIFSDKITDKIRPASMAIDSCPSSAASTSAADCC